MTAFALRVAGSLFVAAALMLWLGWGLLRVRPSGFFLPRQFAEIRADYRRWIWLYRAHIFGYLVTIMGAAALAAAVEGPDARVRIWPGVAVLAIGSIVGALGAAFYYHMGAWGSVDLDGRGEDEIMPGWVAVTAGLLGFAAIGVTMAKPDELERYRPIFLNAAWMLVLGVVMLRAGLGAAG